MSSDVAPASRLVADIDTMKLGSSLTRLAVTLLGAPLACRSRTIPTPSSLRSDITLLYNNDLNRESSLHE